MSCYLRHFKVILAEANIEVTTENRKQIDQAFHKIVDVGYKDCPVTWKKLKQEWLTDDGRKSELVKHLKKALSEPVQ